jgi:hypothetical protein
MLAEPVPLEDPKIVGVLLRLTQTFPTPADSLTPAAGTEFREPWARVSVMSLFCRFC